MTGPELDACNDNTITTATLRFDNRLDSCQSRNRRGGWEVTMAGFIYASRCSGRRLMAGVPRDSISSNGSSFPRIFGSPRQSLSNSPASLRHASVARRSSGEIRGCGDAPDHRIFLIQKVLRFWQKGRSSSPRLARINSGFLSGNSLAAKGDTLIHGPHLVAQSVGSEWRNHHLFQKTIQTNY
jgi:hypothetical protein